MKKRSRLQKKTEARGKRCFNRVDGKSDPIRINSETKDSEATIYLYDEISFWGISAQDFIGELNALGDGVTTIHLRVNSPGGDVFAARAMKTALEQHPAKIIAHIDGIAASAATFLLMGADEIEMADGAFFMIHNAASYIDFFGYFNADEMQTLAEDIVKEAEITGKIDASIRSDYIKRTGTDEEQIMAWMDAESWFDAAEALEHGFIDRIFKDEKPAENLFDLSGYQNTPEQLTKAREQPPKPEKQFDRAAMLRRLDLISRF